MGILVAKVFLTAAGGKGHADVFLDSVKPLCLSVVGTAKDFFRPGTF